MQRNLFFSYSLLVIYVIIGIVQNQYLKKEIQKKRNHIIELRKLLINDENTLIDNDMMNHEYELFICILDSIIKKKTLLKSIPKPISSKEPVATQKSKLVPKPESIPRLSIISKTDSIPRTASNSKSNIKSIHNDFSLSIKNIFSDFNGLRPIKINDRYIIIEVEYTKGAYKNSLRTILNRIQVNDNYVKIKDITESDKKNQAGHPTSYYIKVLIPNGILNKRMNKIVIYANKDYTKWFQIKY